MRLARNLRRFAFVAVAALATTACASSGGMNAYEDAEEVRLNVLNNTDEYTVTVSIEDIEGNVVPLGNVRQDRNERLIFQLPEAADTYRLIAVGPEDANRNDYHISETFVVEDGAVINWYLGENELEVN